MFTHFSYLKVFNGFIVFSFPFGTEKRKRKYVFLLCFHYLCATDLCAIKAEEIIFSFPSEKEENSCAL